MGERGDEGMIFYSARGGLLSERRASDEEEEVNVTFRLFSFFLFNLRSA
jgi:hypothetical protein